MEDEDTRLEASSNLKLFLGPARLCKQFKNENSRKGIPLSLSVYLPAKASDFSSLGPEDRRK